MQASASLGADQPFEAGGAGLGCSSFQKLLQLLLQLLLQVLAGAGGLLHYPYLSLF